MFSSTNQPASRGKNGRKPKAEKYSGAIDKAERRIADRLPELIDSMFELAKGVTVQSTNPLTGDETIYAKPPDRAAIEYLVNRVMGKPTEKQEVDMVANVRRFNIIASPETHEAI